MKRNIFRIACLLLAVVMLHGCGTSVTRQAGSRSDETAAAETQAGETQAADITAPQTAAEQAQLYTAYLNDVGYEKVLWTYDDSHAQVEAESCLVDIDGDGVRELLLHLTDKAAQGVGGYYAATVLLGMRGETVELRGVAEYGGGSGGGDTMRFCYDTQTGKHLLVYDSYMRFGAFYNESSLKYYETMRRSSEPKSFETLDTEGDCGTVYEADYRLDTAYLSYQDYSEEIAEVKRETDLYKESDYADGIETFRFNGQYISEAQYETLSARFTDPIDPAYQFKPVTLLNPIPSV